MPAIDRYFFVTGSDHVSYLGWCDNDDGQPNEDGHHEHGGPVVRCSGFVVLCWTCYQGKWEEAVEALSYALSDLAWPTGDEGDDGLCPDHGLHCHDFCTYGEPDPDAGTAAGYGVRGRC